MVPNPTYKLVNLQMLYSAVLTEDIYIVNDKARPMSFSVTYRCEFLLLENFVMVQVSLLTVQGQDVNLFKFWVTFLLERSTCMNKNFPIISTSENPLML